MVVNFQEKHLLKIVRCLNSDSMLLVIISRFLFTKVRLGGGGGEGWSPD